MKIAMVAPFEESIPPEKYGGIELVMHNLIEEFVKLGHDVTLIGTGDSKTSAELVPIFENSIRSLSYSSDEQLRRSIAHIGVGKAAEYLSRHHFDIIHNHLDWYLLSYKPFIKGEIITTLHGPMNLFYQKKIFQEFKRENFVSISFNQRVPMPNINYVANVYNGIDVSKYRYSSSPQDYFAFLGRISPEKGPIQAIHIAKKAGVKLIIAAKIDPVDMEFFEKKVKPLIDRKQIQFIGEVGHVDKVRLLRGARALIAPIQWEEPFGLVFVEAMACGTPVITMRRGAAPEIIVDGKTGFLCKGIADAVRKVNEVRFLSRKQCRLHVEENFSSKKMAEDYLSAFRKVTRNRSSIF